MLRNTEELNDEIYRAMPWVDAGTTAFPGMTYEQGVEAALRWAIGKESERPIEEDYPDE